MGGHVWDVVPVRKPVGAWPNRASPGQLLTPSRPFSVGRAVPWSSSLLIGRSRSTTLGTLEAAEPPSLITSAA